MTRRIGIDIGGTFTDLTVLEGDGTAWLWKEESTPDDPGRAIRQGLDAIAARLELASTEDLLKSCELLVHGSTIATNTVIERNGGRVGLICTRGFRDTLYLRDGFKPDRFNRKLPHPTEFVDRFLRLGVTERVNSRGEIVTPLVEEDVRAAVQTFREAGVDGVSVALLWSIVNSTHEQRIKEIVKEGLPDAPVLLSSDVLPEIREWERTSATVLSSYVLPRLDRYMRSFETYVTEQGLSRRPLIMQINGGCATVDRVLERPVAVIHSGPAAAPAAARYFGAESDSNNFVSVDMGGTSFDVCLIRDGVPVNSKEMMVDEAPLGVPGVEIHSVGAGGGSIGWIDAGGALQVGPQSAGASPGPACYGKGGDKPTVTDANLVLGYLAPGAFLGGRRTLDAARSFEVLAEIAEPLGLETEEAAAGINRIVNANMVNAIRAVSVQRGIDPRGFVLVSGGGAGGIHIGRLAAELGVREVLIPAQAGLYCAFGMTVTDVRHDLSRHQEALTSQLTVDEMEGVFAELETDGRRMLAEDGFEPDRTQLVRSIDARYPNQVHELSVEIPASVEGNSEALKDVEEAFHQQHEQLFKYSMRDLPVQILQWRVAALGLSPAAKRGDDVSAPGSRTAKPSSRRPIYLHEHQGFVDVDIYDGDSLEAGICIEGPAVVEGENTTIVAFEGQTLDVGRNSFTLIVEPTVTAASGDRARALAGRTVGRD